MLNEKETAKKAIGIVKQFDGLTLIEAQLILKECSMIITNTNKVDVKNELFVKACEELLLPSD